jgi:metal-responsive CopG/Arc/MetJ family transcriptional regulator
MATKKPKPKQMVHMRLDLTLLKRLDDFRFDNRFGSRSEAARQLLIWALDQKPVLSKVRGHAGGKA